MELVELNIHQSHEVDFSRDCCRVAGIRFINHAIVYTLLGPLAFLLANTKQRKQLLGLVGKLSGRIKNLFIKPQIHPEPAFVSVQLKAVDANKYFMDLNEMWNK